MIRTISDSKLGPVPAFDAVLWAYRLILKRDPETAEVVNAHMAMHGNLDSLRDAFMSSPEISGEYIQQKRKGLSSDLAEAFTPYAGPGSDGSFTDFLGTRTRCSFLPDMYKSASGAVEGPPGTERYGLHEIAEWEGTLRSVFEAKGSLTVVELGAGWAPWLIASAFAARQRGIEDVRLCGIEGASSHFAFMRQHFVDNGIEPNAHQLRHAIIGVEDGIARFPVLDNPHDIWGAEAVFDRGEPSARFEEVECVSIPTLLRDMPRVDLLHCDIQGAEADVLSSAIDILTDRVRRIVIGTHGRIIEDRLMKTFSAAGWTIEAEKACLFRQLDTGEMHLTVDGVQVWVNPKLAI